MSIENGYCTLTELRQRLLDRRSYTAATIAFVSSTKKITDTRKGLRNFSEGNVIQVSGSTSNDGYYTVATGSVAGEIVVDETLTDEPLGDTVTIFDASEPVDDGMLERIVEGVSRSIDEYTGHRFYRPSSDETRYYTAEESTALVIDDVGSLTTLATDSDGDRTYENTWTATDYDLMPYNAALDSRPYDRLEVPPAGSYAFPVGVQKGVQIVAKFGWCTLANVPQAVTEACLLISEQLAMRRDAPFGIISSPTGESQRLLANDIMKRDPHIRFLLGTYARVYV